MTTPAKALEPFIDAIADRVIERLHGPRVTTVKETAVKLSCSTDHVYHLISEGQLKAVDIKIGDGNRVLRITTEDFERYLERRRRAA